MGAIHFISFGKLKLPGLRECADYYLKRMEGVSAGKAGARRAEISEIELKSVAVPDKSSATRARIQTQEGEMLLARLSSIGGVNKPTLILLDETGRAMPTEKWAELLARETSGPRDLIFAIGSSLGFSAEVRGRTQFTLSLGPQTLPHELARVVMYEQVYRAMSLNAGHPYHNAGM